MSPENVDTVLRVLVAEDNEADAELLLRNLRRNGFSPQATVVSKEEEFSRHLDESTELILADYDMGTFSGLRALAIVRERGLQTPFILISGMVGEDIAVEAIRLGAFDYLLKDRLTRLPVAVRQAVEQGRLRRERVRNDAALRLFRTLVDQSSDMFKVIDPASGRYLDVNEKSCSMLGYTMDDYLRLYVWDIDLQITATSWPDIVDRIRRAGEAGLLMEGVSRRKDGSLFPVERSSRFVTLDRDYLVTVARDITDRKRVEKRLRESERSLAMAQRVAQVGSWRLELVDGVLREDSALEWSDELFRVFGHMPGAIAVSNETFFAHVHPEDRERVRMAVREALRTGTTYRIDHRIVRADGAERIVHERAEIVRDEETGLPVALVGTAQDVTERRRTAAALNKSREDFRLLFEANPMPMWVYDHETLGFLAVNEAAIRHYGYTREEFLSMTIKEIRPREEVSLLLSVVNAPANSRSVASAGVWRHRKKNGEIILVEITFRSFTFQARPAELILANDVTAQRANVEALRESEERFRQLAESIAAVFWLKDTSAGTVLYVSPAYANIWGRSCESVYENPKSWLDAVHPEDRERITSALAHQNPEHYHEVYRVVRPDGSIRWVRDRAFPIRDRDGTLYRLAGTAEDITDLRNLEEQVRQAQKLEAIGTLAGGIAHDFNNILGAIIGYVELAKMTISADGHALAHLEMVLQAAQRAAALVRQILAFSRQQQQQRVPLHLKQAVAEPLKLLRATIPANIEFDVRLEANLPLVQADPTQVHQVIMNLCTNAAHAMGERPGKLSVTLDRFLMDARTASVGTRLKPGMYVRLTVADTGCGMDSATLERIFEPFFTTKGPGEGTGLGLSVVHGIMEAHEGAVSVQSRPGAGTTFVLYFPAEGSMPTETKPPEKIEVPRGAGQRVLFVDDEEPLAQLAQSILEALGYKPTALTDGMEALRRIREDPQGVDLVIVDLSMPRITGTDFAREVLALRADLPIVLITGYTAKLTPEVVRSLGIRELLLKPFTFGALGTTVHKALHGRNA